MNNSEANSPTRTPRILVVDDEASVRHVLSTYLRRQGCDVQTAGASEEAMELLARATPDVALVDIVLPGKDGIYLLGRIKQQFPDIEVVLITCHASIESAIKAIRLGAYDYLRKPFQQLENVWLTVQRALEKRYLSLRVNDLVLQQGIQGEELLRAADRLVSSGMPVEHARDMEPEETPTPVGDSES